MSMVTIAQKTLNGMEGNNPSSSSKLFAGKDSTDLKVGEEYFHRVHVGVDWVAGLLAPVVRRIARLPIIRLFAQMPQHPHTNNFNNVTNGVRLTALQRQARRLGRVANHG